VRQHSNIERPEAPRTYRKDLRQEVPDPRGLRYRAAPLIPRSGEKDWRPLLTTAIAAGTPVGTYLG
jgi:hypothetical protein